MQINRSIIVIAVVAIIVIAGIALGFGSPKHREEINIEATTTPSTSTATTTDLTLGVDQTGKVGEFSITFNSLVQDNRCPIDVQCIEAGAVTANVTFTQGSHLETKNVSSDEVPSQFEEYAISIASVTPARESQKEIPPTAYHITFHIENTLHLPPS